MDNCWSHFLGGLAAGTVLAFVASMYALRQSWQCMVWQQAELNRRRSLLRAGGLDREALGRALYEIEGSEVKGRRVPWDQRSGPDRERSMAVAEGLAGLVLDSVTVSTCNGPR
jgi:hypothetical protein